MTNFERFQRLQVELVRAGFETELRARPDGDDAVIELQVNLVSQNGAGIEKLDALTGGHGFDYTVGEQSRAAVTLVRIG